MTTSEAQPEVCDLCQQAIAPGQGVGQNYRDSSFAHPVDHHRDGIRRLRACRPGHLLELQQGYRRRPFTDEELWAAKIERVMRRYPQGTSLENLAVESGLSMFQVEAATVWRLRCGESVSSSHSPSLHTPVQGS
ncbi:hypothetical protein [Streptomyces sp. A0592]|uniref:hypothetical protein n=1 Tax=Streptomyces sp. A0592 TaxID=2563099 RepID=UPI00109ECBC1|nr:hypothetical protein [Streptomyces sp. A0592]THA75421.1 hypothetical protein E6U81_36715 [Streptomyces sp. A0592]